MKTTVTIKKTDAADQSYGRGMDNYRVPARYGVFDSDGTQVGVVCSSSSKIYYMEDIIWEVKTKVENGYFVKTVAWNMSFSEAKQWAKDHPEVFVTETTGPTEGLTMTMDEDLGQVCVYDAEGVRVHENDRIEMAVVGNHPRKFGTVLTVTVDWVTVLWSDGRGPVTVDVFENFCRVVMDETPDGFERDGSFADTVSVVGYRDRDGVVMCGVCTEQAALSSPGSEVFVDVMSDDTVKTCSVCGANL